MSDTPAIPPRVYDAEGNVAGERREGPATPAATVVALRDSDQGPEALLLRRRRGGAFSGMWVFPGGKVEAGDADLAGVAAPGGFAAGHLDPADEIAVARQAAVREAMEEAQLHLAPSDLEVHSYWLPPPEAPRRFSTWFFVAAAGPEGVIVVDLTEVHEYKWLTAERAMFERAAGALALAPPTWMTLWQIDQHPDVAAVLAEARSRPPLRFETHLRAVGGRTTLTWEGDAAYDDGDLERPGPRRRLWLSEDGPWRPEFTAPAGG